MGILQIEKKWYLVLFLWTAVFIFLCADLTLSKQSELEIEPRYPLFGGWKATFVIGYGLPLEDFLFESPDGKRYLNFSFGCPLAQTVVNKLTIKVGLLLLIICIHDAVCLMFVCLLL
jgi:hypothetical protein